MKIGILGPGDIKKYCTNAGLDYETYLQGLERLAGRIAELGHQIVICADKGSTSEKFADFYKAHRGKKVIGVVPKDDKEFGISWLNLSIFDEQDNCGTWRNQPERLAELSDLLISIGWASGVAAEIYAAGWFSKSEKVYVVDDFISGRLPKELDASFKKIVYTSLDKLLSELK
jgi:hypothetical protein